MLDAEAVALADAVAVAVLVAEAVAVDKTVAEGRIEVVPTTVGVIVAQLVVEGDTDADAEHEGNIPVPKLKQPPMKAPPHKHVEGADAPAGQKEPIGQITGVDVPIGQ